AYVLAAQVALALGADILVDDKSNSFHELFRSSVLGACAHFVAAHLKGPDERETSGRALLELVQRTFLGPQQPGSTSNDGGGGSSGTGGCSSSGGSDGEEEGDSSSTSTAPPLLLPRSRYVFTVPGIEPRVHHALCQG